MASRTLGAALFRLDNGSQFAQVLTPAALGENDMRHSAAGDFQDFGSRARRQPILHFGATLEGGSAVPGLAERIRDRSAHPVIAADSGRSSRVSSTRLIDAALGAWYDLETQFNSVCIGLIVEPGPAIAAVARMLIQGCYGGPLPGAIALVGYDAELLATCLELAVQSGRQVGNSADGTVCRITPAVSIEWPPMMIFLPSDDPALADCARTCRKMRAAGIAMSLDVVGAVRNRPQSDVEAVTFELAEELENFFDTYLTPYFPKLL